MKRYVRKKHQQRQKRQIRKSVSTTKLHSYTQWKWLIAVIVVIIGCFALVVFVSSQRSSASDITRIDATASPTTISGPTLVGGANLQRVQQATGIFSLAEGGPIPVPANVLHPTNIARVADNNMLTSIYAGAMVRTPTIGAIAILEENITTGKQSLHIYQTAQPVGAVTILAIRDGILTLSTPTAHGTFNLHTNAFHFT